jgi:hypothetical protein
VACERMEYLQRTRGPVILFRAMGARRTTKMARARCKGCGQLTDQIFVRMTGGPM